MSWQTLVSAAELANHLDDSWWVVIDCRFDLADPSAGERAYTEAHIPGARYAHLDRDLSSPITLSSGRHPLPTLRAWAETLGRWGIGAENQVVVYDGQGGAVAVRLWWMLRQSGHSAVALLDGGIQGWTANGGALETESPSVHALPLYPIAEEAFLAVTVDTVVDGLDDDQLQLVDARSAARFRGDEEPLDPVAGHIPGALNRPFQDNLTSTGLFKTAAQLSQEYRQLLGDHRPATVVHYCGSGVTACHNLLAMEYAGLTGSRLYAGSWSEWIRDPRRPMAVGP